MVLQLLGTELRGIPRVSYRSRNNDVFYSVVWHIGSEHETTMDPFSKVLDTIHLKGAVHCHATLGVPWGFRRRPSSAVEFIAVVEGSAFLTMEDLGRWLEAMTDRQIGRALAAVHQSPDDRWTVEKLAREAFMSRTAFATRFTELMGESPMQYLTRWRLHAASEVLRTDDSATVAEAARAAGYQSVSSFSKVFKREVGSPPGAFRERVHADTAAAARRSQVKGKAQRM